MDRLNSLFVYTYGVDTIPVGVLADSLSSYLKITVHRIDKVISYSKLYYFVHFLEPVPRKYREEIQNLGKQFLFTTKGLLQIGLDTSGGLDPNTKDKVSQYINKDGEWYCKDLNCKEIYKWDTSIWSITEINPFEVAD